MKRFIKNDGGIYHCMSRTVQGRRFLGAVEREVLRKMIWQLADFSGLRVITYCLMNNHFHILVEVPKEQAVDDAELVRRFSVLYPKGHKRLNLRAVDLAAELEAGARGDELRDWLLGRMGDLSIFMKILKQRFSIWYNETHETFGAVWAERFKSVLVEGRRFVLQAMAAYIDLNPVRAGLVKDPKDYRFCGYGEAVVGNSAARAGVQRVMGVFAPEGNAQAALAGYRTLLYQRGSDAVDGRGAISERAVEQVLKAGGGLTLAEVLRCRIRFFTTGKVLGSETFVREVMSNPAYGSTASGRRRKLRKALPGALAEIFLLSGRRDDAATDGG